MKTILLTITTLTFFFVFPLQAHWLSDFLFGLKRYEKMSCAQLKEEKKTLSQQLNAMKWRFDHSYFHPNRGEAQIVYGFTMENYQRQLDKVMEQILEKNCTP